MNTLEEVIVDAITNGISFTVDSTRRDIVVGVTCGNGLKQQWRHHLLPDEITNAWIVKRELIELIVQAKLCARMNPAARSV